MKKFLALFLLAIIFAGCTQEESAEPVQEPAENGMDMHYEQNGQEPQDEPSEPRAFTSDDWVIEYDGQQIPAPEYEFSLRFVQIMQMFGELPGEAEPHELALDMLANSLLINQAAARHDITPLEENLEEYEFVIFEINDILPQIGLEIPEVSDERMIEIMSSDNLKWQLLPIYVGDLEIDEQELSAAAEDFALNNRREFTQGEFRYIVADTIEEAMHYRQEIINSAPDGISDTIRRLVEEGIAEAGEEPLDEDWFVPVAYMHHIRQWEEMGQLASEDVEALTNMQPGDITEPLYVTVPFDDADDIYIIFIVDSIEVRDLEEVDQIFRAGYERDRQLEAFEEVLSRWREEANMIFNQPVIDAVNALGDLF